MVGFLRCCVVGLLSLSVLTAHAARTIVVEPSQIERTYSPGQAPHAFSDSRNWDTPVSTQNGSKVNLPVKSVRKTTWPTFRGALKSALKLNPARLAASAAITGAVVGLDWIFESSQIKAPNTVPSNPQGNICYQYGSTCYSDIAVMCSVAMKDWPGSSNPVTTIINNVGYCSFKYGSQGVSVTRQPTYLPSCPSGSTISGTVCVNDLDPYRIPTDADFDLLTGAITSPSEAAEIAPYLYDVPGSYDQFPPDSTEFTGPASLDLPTTTTTTTDPATGSTSVTESFPSIQLEYGTDPFSVTATPTTVTNTYQDGNLTSTSTTTSTSTETTVETLPEVPTDCEFMPTVCSFIDWVKSPFQEQEPDLSDLIADDDYQKNIDFSSNASCPAPSIMATSQGSFEFSWQPACQWAGMVRPFIIIAALLAAIFINLGAIRGPN